MSYLCNLQLHINGQETFFVNEKIACTHSEKLRKLVTQEKKKTQRSLVTIELNNFPGGPQAFELVFRIFHSNGGTETTALTATNIALLHCCAIFLGSSNNLVLQKTETFLEGMFEWPFKDLISCLKTCDSIFSHADSCGLVEKLVIALMAKIAQSSDTPSSSPESVRLSSLTKAWWFEEMMGLSPKIIERVVVNMRNKDNNGLSSTKFLLHYLKRRRVQSSKSDFRELAEKAVKGVLSASKDQSFSCRSLFWVLRIVSAFGVNRELRLNLERLIGEALHGSKLDDLLVCGNNGGVYDVDLVIRLARVFVASVSDQSDDRRMKKVGGLVDDYLAEISPDQTLRVSKFLGVAESVPDSARDSSDGVYRAIDIYLQSQPSLSSEERAKLCRCVNYKKLSLEACKELAKNPKIPPRIAMKALISQRSRVCVDPENDDAKAKLQRMQRRVSELERACREMKGQLARVVCQKLPRLC